MIVSTKNGTLHLDKSQEVKELIISPTWLLLEEDNNASIRQDGKVQEGCTVKIWMNFDKK